MYATIMVTAATIVGMRTPSMERQVRSPMQHHPHEGKGVEVVLEALEQVVIIKDVLLVIVLRLQLWLCGGWLADHQLMAGCDLSGVSP